MQLVKMEDKALVCYYAAKPGLEAVQLPMFIRGQYICDSIEEACAKALECAKQDAAKMENQEWVDLDVDESISIQRITKPGYYARWIPECDERNSEGSYTHRTLGLYFSRTKQGWFTKEYAGKARPQRYYVITLAKNASTGSRIVHADDASLENSSTESTEDDEKGPLTQSVIRPSFARRRNRNRNRGKNFVHPQ